MRDDFEIWVDAVCGQVRFSPDRKGIAKELRTHYEDHYQDLLRLNYSPELAAERALKAMGDAQEVGRALDRVHKPWLGWLWETSRWAAWGLLALALVVVFRITDLGVLVEQARRELAWEEPPAAAAWVELGHATLWAAPGEITEREGHAVAAVRLWIKMRDPWGGPQSGRTWLFSWRDGQGEISPDQFDFLTRTWPENRYWRYAEQGDRGAWRCYQETVELVLDAPPEWAELSYPLSGQDWTLRVEWGAEA